jgi:hypothetical protein
MMAMKPLSFAILLVSGTIADSASAQDFRERCAQLPQQVKVAVVFRDRQVTVDETRSVQELNRMSTRPAADYHNVYGVTYAKPGFRLLAAPRMLDDGSGQICALPDIMIELGFTEFVVYLAKELTDPCHKDIIRQHEQDHVNTWKSQMRASAQLLTTVLRRDMGEARYYMSRGEAEAAVRAWASELAAPWLKRMLDSVTAAQNAIDTQVSYDTVTSRLRTCGQAVRGGSR